MTVHVNGQAKELETSATVAALVEALGLGQKRVAVEVNKELVVKKEWSAKVLCDGDRVEVVSFVGGG
jgi:sulfur carrier protein